MKIIIIQLICSIIASFAFGIQYNIKLRHISVAAIGGGISQLIFSLTEAAYGEELLNYFVAACAISVYAELMARILHVPVNMYLVIALIPLVPGAYIYNAMMTLISGNTAEFITQATFTFGVAGSIAMGVFAVSSVVRLFSGIIKKKEK